MHATLSRFQAEVGDGWPSWALSNHDCVRLATRWAAPAATGVASASQSRAYIALQLSLRGSPCLYQGDELGLPEAEIAFDDLQDPYGKTMWPRFKGRDGCRTPMPWVSAAPDLGFGNGAARPWLPVAESHRALAADDQAANAGSLLNHYRDLLAWRRRQPALVQGNMSLLPAHPQVFALLRGHASEQILCAFNLSDQPATWAPPPGLAVDQVLCPSADAPNACFIAGGELQFEAYGVFFARLV